ncbi:MAG: hypothetical protein HY262_00635 [Chloroflexi bacterium]|nr:hypothetical protein [Chloroflexota bacterium]
MTDASGALAALLADAREADPAHRIDLRDPIAAHGAAAIEAVGPWLKEPALAAFAIRVIARAGLDGERETALAALRSARRRLDPRFRADVDWALGVLKVERVPEPVAARAPVQLPPRIERPRTTSRRPRPSQPTP